MLYVDRTVKGNTDIYAMLDSPNYSSKQVAKVILKEIICNDNYSVESAIVGLGLRDDAPDTIKVAKLFFKKATAVLKMDLLQRMLEQDLVQMYRKALQKTKETENRYSISPTTENLIENKRYVKCIDLDNITKPMLENYKGQVLLTKICNNPYTLETSLKKDAHWKDLFKEQDIQYKFIRFGYYWLPEYDSLIIDYSFCNTTLNTIELKFSSVEEIDGEYPIEATTMKVCNINEYLDKIIQARPDLELKNSMENYEQGNLINDSYYILNEFKGLIEHIKLRDAFSSTISRGIQQRISNFEDAIEEYTAKLKSKITDRLAETQKLETSKMTISKLLNIIENNLNGGIRLFTNELYSNGTFSFVTELQPVVYYDYTKFKDLLKNIINIDPIRKKYLTSILEGNAFFLVEPIKVTFATDDSERDFISEREKYMSSEYDEVALANKDNAKEAFGECVAVSHHYNEHVLYYDGKGCRGTFKPVFIKAHQEGDIYQTVKLYMQYLQTINLYDMLGASMFNTLPIYDVDEDKLLITYKTSSGYYRYYSVDNPFKEISPFKEYMRRLRN